MLGWILSVGIIATVTFSTYDMVKEEGDGPVMRSLSVIQVRQSDETVSKVTFTSRLQILLRLGVELVLFDLAFRRYHFCVVKSTQVYLKIKRKKY